LRKKALIRRKLDRIREHRRKSNKRRQTVGEGGTRMIFKKKETCPECGSDLVYSDADCKGHCAHCQQRGQ